MNLSIRFRIAFLLICCMLFTVKASSQKSHTPTSASTNRLVTDSLEQLSASLPSLSRQVEPAVVQIFNSAYAIEADSERNGGSVVSQEPSSGSGVLISADGFIVTNSHVIQGARRLWVRLDKQVPGVSTRSQSAQLVGMDPQTDLAVIKIDVTGLPSLKFADSSLLNQGQIVLAFGSPLGLENSVAAKLAGRHRPGDELFAGDVIHAVNGAEIRDVPSLRDRLESLTADSPLVIQVERSGSLHLVGAPKRLAKKAITLRAQLRERQPEL